MPTTCSCYSLWRKIFWSTKLIPQRENR